jgi:cysteine desulfurase
VAVERARERVAEVLGCEGAEVVFTSGGTEADNLALRGVLTSDALREAGRTGLVTGAAEHEAILQAAGALDRAGHAVQILKPGPSGAVSPDRVREALSEGIGLVSLMAVNNETGTVTDLRAVAELAHEAGAFFHTDAVQAAGLLELNVDRLGVDLMSVSAHKCGGPKGVGALYVRSGTPLEAQVTGGAQERRRRGGTENVASIVGFAEALAQADREREDTHARLASLQRRLAERLRAAFGETVRFNTPLNGFAEHAADGSPHVLNVSFPPKGGRALDGEMLLLGLDVAGVCASSGSACSSGAVEPSHVLQAMGVPRETAQATVRFSFGHATTEADVDRAAEVLAQVVGRMG